MYCASNLRGGFSSSLSYSCLTKHKKIFIPVDKTQKKKKRKKKASIQVERPGVEMIITATLSIHDAGSLPPDSNTAPLPAAHYTTFTLHETANIGALESQFQTLSRTLTATHSQAMMLEQNTNKHRQTLKTHMTGHT